MVILSAVPEICKKSLLKSSLTPNFTCICIRKFFKQLLVKIVTLIPKLVIREKIKGIKKINKAKLDGAKKLWYLFLRNF